MSWFSRQPVMRPDDINETGYTIPAQVDTQHHNYADYLQAGVGTDSHRADDSYPMGTIVAQMHSTEWPGYMGAQHFKGEFTDVSDVVYASQFAGMGYRNNINQDVGGETGAANAVPMWTVGPVTGRASNMTGSTATIKRPKEGAYGDVNGAGQDYGRQLSQAYYADAMAQYVTEYVNAGLMAAI